MNFIIRESLAKLSETGGKLSFRASEARPGIQSRSERDSKNSGFRLRRNTGVSDFCKSLTLFCVFDRLCLWISIISLFSALSAVKNLSCFTDTARDVPVERGSRKSIPMFCRGQTVHIDSVNLFQMNQPKAVRNNHLAWIRTIG